MKSFYRILLADETRYLAPEDEPIFEEPPAEVIFNSLRFVLNDRQRAERLASQLK